MLGKARSGLLKLQQGKDEVQFDRQASCPISGPI